MKKRLMLSLGAVALITAGGVSFYLGRVMEWSATVTPFAVPLAFTPAVTIGVFVGFYPARKAALMNPIEALRYE